MLHELPIANVRLLACHEDWHRMTPTERGRHCRSCDREVVDFTQAPAAALAGARAASADGRVCGRFRPGQLLSGRPVRFGLWARAFALTAALVLGQGLTARQAWAQTRKATTTKTAVRRPAARPTSPPKPALAARPVAVEPESSALLEPVPEPPAEFIGKAYVYADKTPEPPGGMEMLRQYLRKHLQYPEKARLNHVEGLVFVNFVVAPDGQLTTVSVSRGIGFGCDEEAVRVVSQLAPWRPGRHNGRPVAVSYTLPVRFKLTEPE